MHCFLTLTSDNLDRIESELHTMTEERNALATEASRHREVFEQLSNEFARSKESAERLGLESKRHATEQSVAQNQLLILQARSR